METELKFQVPRAHRAALHAAVDTASAQTTRLQAVYAETADRRLAAHGLALRLRQEDRVWVQTLKGRGDGLMNREEHEVRLPPLRGTPLLDVTRHADTAVGQRLLAVLGGEPLRPLYRTDIRRLHRRVRTAGAVIEIARDRGWLIAGDGSGGQPLRRCAVDEIEFELVSGSPQRLVGVALGWMARHGLWWDCRTKSERGMRLALGLTQVPETAAGPARAVRSFAGWQAALAATLMQALPNAAELADGQGHAGHAQALQTALQRLSRLLASVHAGPHAAAAQALQGALRPWLDRAHGSPRDLAFNATMLGVLALSLPLPATPAAV